MFCRKAYFVRFPDTAAPKLGDAAKPKIEKGRKKGFYVSQLDIYKSFQIVF